MKCWIGVSAALIVTSVFAQQNDLDPGYLLAGEKGCFECHAPGYDYVGPSFRSLAERYRFDPEARAQLPSVLQAGSRGHWGGRFEMRPQIHLTPEQLQRLVDWVLAQ